MSKRTLRLAGASLTVAGMGLLATPLLLIQSPIDAAPGVSSAKVQCANDTAALAGLPATSRNRFEGCDVSDPGPKAPEVVTDSASAQLFVDKNKAQRFSFADLIKLPNYAGADVEITSAPTHGSLSTSSAGAVYKPGADFVGTDSLTFKATSTDGHRVLNVVVSIDVVEVAVDPHPAPSKPSVPTKPAEPSTPRILTHDDLASAISGESVTVDVLSNDTHSATAPLRLSAVTTTDGHAMIVDNKIVLESPDEVLTERVITVTYTATDGSVSATGTLSVTVQPRLVVLEDSYTLTTGRLASLDVLNNDSGKVLRLVGVAGPLHGEIKMNDRYLSYSADDAFSGTTTFSYTVRDDYGNTGTAQVKLVINPMITSAPVQVPTSTSTPTTDPVVLVPLPIVTSAPTTSPTGSATASSTTTAAAAANTATAVAPSTSAAATGGSLAHTGYDAMPVLLTGAGLVVIGGAAMAMSKRGERKH